MSKLIIVGPASPLRGGISDFNEALADELATQGYEIEIISFSLQYPSFLFPGKSQFHSNPTYPSKYHIKALINSINPFSWIKTVRYIKNENPKAVIFRFWIPFMGMSLGYIARKIKSKGISVYAITDNVIPHEKRLGDRFLTNYFLKGCNGFITMSKSVFDDISLFTNNSNKVCLFHPLYNVFGTKSNKEKSLIELNIPEGRYLLFFGLIREYKGLELAIKAMNNPEIKKLKLKLIIAGEFYSSKEKYLSLINNLGLANDIIIHDEFISKEKVKYYFGVSDAVVQPYLTATQSGITQIAYNFETPMIVTNVGGLSEIVEDGKQGFVCDVNSNAVSEAILKLYKHKDTLAQIRNQVALKKDSFSWEFFVKELKSFTNI